jgi:hypothetical protein
MFLLRILGIIRRMLVSCATNEKKKLEV